MALLTGLTETGQEVPVQVDASGRLVAEGLAGPQGPQGLQGPAGPQGPQGEPGSGGGLNLATAKAATGTSIDFTGIPSWAKRVTVMFAGVSTNGMDPCRIQLGVGGTAVTSGYVTGSWSVTTSVASSVAHSPGGFDFVTSSPGSVQEGKLTLSKVSSTVWVGEGSFYDSNPIIRMAYVAGRVSGLSGDVNMLRVTTANGTDAFDAGTINILYE